MGVHYHAPMPRARVYDVDAVRFGAIIRSIREQRGWTKKKLATRAGLTPTYIGIVEEGGNVPSLTTILELTEVLGVDVGEIMRHLANARNKPAPSVAVVAEPPATAGVSDPAAERS